MQRLTHFSFLVGTSAIFCAAAGFNATAQSECSATAPSVNLGSLGPVQNADIIETALAAGSFKTLAAALQAADLVDALKGDGPFVVFAPTDDAFAKLPQGTIQNLLKPENKATLQAILLYHVVSGEAMAEDVLARNSWETLGGQRIDIGLKGGATVDSANIIKTDIQCSNGVIHVIDAVLMPETRTIVETGDAAGMFSTLLAAAQAAGIAETLMGDGPFTIFAPTDDAFAQLPEGTVAELLKPENKEQLAAILKDHVVQGRVYADDAIAAGSAVTLQGSRIRCRLENGRLLVQGANVIKNDIEAANGVIHVIDRVILPN